MKLEVRENEYGAYYILHDKKSYILKIDNGGRLILSAGGNDIVIKPIAANCIEIKSEE